MRHRNIFYNLIVLSAVLILCFLALEFIFSFIVKQPQVVHSLQHNNSPINSIETSQRPEALYINTPTGKRLMPNTRLLIRNHRLNGRDVEIVTNSLGFRGPELGDKLKNQIRILVLGDSITLGDYIGYEEVYVSQLEKELRTNGELVHVINAGVGAINLETEYYILKEKGLFTKPDIVVVGLYLNDASESLVIEPLKAPFCYSRFLTWVREKIFIIEKTILLKRQMRLLKVFTGERKLNRGAWANNPSAFDAEIASAFTDWGYAWTLDAWDEINRWLVRINDLGKVEGFKVIVVLFPVRYQVEADFLNDVPQEFFHKSMDRLNIPHLDLLQVLREEWKSTGNELFYDQCHLTPYGNSVVGHAISKFLMEWFKEKHF